MNDRASLEIRDLTARIDELEGKWDTLLSAWKAAGIKDTATINELEAERDKWRTANHALSHAYVRLRAIIPGAFDTPTAPSPEQVWAITEEAAKRLLAERDNAEAQTQRYKASNFAANARIAALEAEVNHLQGENDRLRDVRETRIAELEGERNRLKAALKPFHDAVFYDNGDVTVDLSQISGTAPYYTAYRAYRAALSGKGSD